MNDATIKRLNFINRDFYQITADSFDESRGAAWPGWDRLLPHLRPPLTVLDIGCGNGRLGRFLADHLGASNVRYWGIDNNPTLLERARASLSDVQEAVFVQQDIVASTLESRKPDFPQLVGEGPGVRADLVALFGILHHIPGLDQRRALIRTAANSVAPGGILVFACWRFMDYARFRDRIIPWPDDLRDQIERGDYLLDWRRGESAVRYCHYVDDAEHTDLVAASGLQEIATSRADGESGDMNRYSILGHSK